MADEIIKGKTPLGGVKIYVQRPNVAIFMEAEGGIEPP